MEKLGMYILLPSEKRAELENRVDSFFRDRNIELDVGTDITRVCNTLGIRVLSVRFPKSVSPLYHGILFVDGDDKRIGVNSEIAESCSARFVVAHELSHYITKVMSGSRKSTFVNADKIFSLNDEKPMEEREMDYMAAAILVRKDIFKKDISVLGISNILNLDDAEDANKLNPHIVRMLSERFNVMEDVIKRRIVEVL